MTMVNKKKNALTGATAPVVALAYKATDFRDYLGFLMTGVDPQENSTRSFPLTNETVFIEWLTEPSLSVADPISPDQFEFVGLSIGETYDVEGARTGTRRDFKLRFAAVFKRSISNADLNFTYEAVEINFPEPDTYQVLDRFELVPYSTGEGNGRLEFSSRLDTLDQQGLPSFSFALFPLSALLNLTANDNQTLYLSGTLIEFGGGHLSYEHDEYFTLKLEASLNAFSEVTRTDGEENPDTPSPEESSDEPTPEVGVPAFMIGTPCPPHWRFGIGG